MIYNKTTKNYKKIILNIDIFNYNFIKNQACMHDISCSCLINKILSKYVTNCKQNIKNL